MKRKTNKNIKTLVGIAVLLFIFSQIGAFQQAIFNAPASSLLQVDRVGTYGSWMPSDIQYAAYSNVVKINDYEIRTSYGRCGDYLNICSATYNIYDSGVLVESKSYCGKPSEHIVVGGIDIEPMWSTYNDISGCQYVSNMYNIRIPDDAINILVSTPEAHYFEGQEVVVNVYIDNQWTATDAKLDVEFQVPTIFGLDSKVESQDIHLELGENVVSFIIPTTDSTEKILVTPKISIVLPSSRISGLNSLRSGLWVPIQGGVVVKDDRSYLEPAIDYNLGTAVEKTFEIMIVPKPLSLPPLDDETCITGYEMNVYSGLCVRDDVKDLSCYIRGCPVVEGKEIECTSAGICAETVYVTVQGDCPVRTTPTTTDEGAQICIKTEIAEVFLQCTATTLPPPICEGVSAMCVDGFWEFTGECEVITEIEVIEEIKVVEVVTEKYITVTDDSGVITKELAFFSFVVIIFITHMLVAKTKKKKKR